jgi:threonine dehydratase
MPAAAQNELVSLDDIRAAARRLHGLAVHTPLQRIPQADLAAAGLHLPFTLSIKREDLQPIGSFKVRGACNYLKQLSPDELSRGVISYSSGNHAQGVAFGARALGVPATIVMPSIAPQIKVDATRALGATVVIAGIGSSERRLRAEELARTHGYTIVPPYNHAGIIAGAGTCGLEIAADDPALDCVLTPVGGGGLLSGTSAAVKNLLPSARVFGVEPELAADAAASFREHHVVELTGEQTARTMADGLRTQSVGDLNLRHLLAFVDGILTVSEDEIARAMRLLERLLGVMPEPSGAVAFASAALHPERLAPARHVAVVLSGGNLDPAVRAQVTASA